MRQKEPCKELAWEVSLPGKRSSSSFGPKPRADVTIGSGDSIEHVAVPVAVGRILLSKKKAGEIHPQSRAELLYLVGETSRICARARIERMIDRREYSSDEVSKKLRMDGYSSKVIDECVERACEVGLISDRRYADSFIRSKVYAGWGMQRIARELRQRGVSVEDVPGWPYEYLDPEDEITRALDVARTRRVSGQRAYEKLVRYLCNRGFATGVASRAARQVLDEHDEADLVDF